MRTRLLIIGILAGGLATAAPAFAEIEGDAFRGKAYAGAMCASCHALSAEDGASPDPTAPPLRNFKLAATTGEEFVEWFNTKHPQGSSSQPKPAQAQDMLAYMASLPKD